MPTAKRPRSRRATLRQLGLIWLTVPFVQNCVPGAAFSENWDELGGSVGNVGGKTGFGGASFGGSAGLGLGGTGQNSGGTFTIDQGGNSAAATGGASIEGGASNPSSTQSTGGIGNTGGVSVTGGSPAIGGVSATGGAAGIGGVSVTGGAAGTGGVRATGGTVSTHVTGGTGAGGSTSSSARACAGVAICGRAPDGVYCAQSDGASGFIDFSRWTQAYGDANGWKAVQSYWATLQFPDLDGNGRADICARSASGIVCGLSNDTGGFAYPSGWSTHFGDDGGWNASPSYWATIQFPDINGDGKADVCGRSGSGIECAISNGANGFGTASLWHGDFSDAAHWATTQSYWGTIQFPDINGDGKTDICGRASAGILCAISNGTDGFGPASFWSSDFSDASSWAASASYWGTLQFPDINGDGKADVCSRSITGISCAISNGINGFGPGSATTWTTNFGDANGWGASQSYWGTIQFPDVNGDGLADVCGRGINGVECAVSSGSGFGANQTWADSFSNSAGFGSDMTLWATVQFPDLDGDGKADVCGRAATGVLCGVSTGVGFTMALWTSHFSDAEGWNSDPSYGLTLQTSTLNGGGCTPVSKRSSLVAIPRRLAPF